MSDLALNRMLDTVALLPADLPMTMVVVRRHPDGAAFGLHLLTENDPMSARQDHRRNLTMGLFNPLDAETALEHFYDFYEVTSAVMPFSGHAEELKAYIREQVIPLEWKSYSDAELDKLLDVTLGAVRHAPTPAQAGRHAVVTRTVAGVEGVFSTLPLDEV
jgi:hypothetical protein